MTTKEYLRDPALAGRMTITAIITAERPVVRTSQTWFHPQGGGQKADRGTIGGVEIYNVRHAPDGEVDHYVADLAGLAVGGAYDFLIDPEWRRINAAYHSAGHLLAAVCETDFSGIKAVNGHHWPGEARVEFEGAELGRLAKDLPALQAELNETISRNLSVRVLGDPFANRTIQIGQFQAIACGGTHVSLSSEIGSIALRSAKQKGDTMRIGYEVILQ